MRKIAVALVAFAAAALLTLTGGVAAAAPTTVPADTTAGAVLAPSAPVAPTGVGTAPPPPGYYWSGTNFYISEDPNPLEYRCGLAGNQAVSDGIASNYYCWITAEGVIAELWLLS